MNQEKTSNKIKLDERNQIEKLLLDQLVGLDSGIIDPTRNQGGH